MRYVPQRLELELTEDEAESVTDQLARIKEEERASDAFLASLLKQAEQIKDGVAVKV